MSCDDTFDFFGIRFVLDSWIESIENIVAIG